MTSYLGNSGSLEVDHGPGANDYFSLDGNYDAAGFSVVTDNNGGTDIVWNHAAPVIDTDQVSVIENSDGTTTIAGLQLSDADPAPSAGTFAVTATSGTSESIDMGNINTALETVTAPSAGNIAVTVTDSFGATETVNFVFNETGNGSERGAAGHGRQGRAVRDRPFRYAHGRRRPGSVRVRADGGICGRAAYDHGLHRRARQDRPAAIRQYYGADPICTEVQQGSDTLITSMAATTACFEKCRGGEPERQRLHPPPRQPCLIAGADGGSRPVPGAVVHSERQT